MQTSNTRAKQERLEARVSPDQKALLQRAAALEGRSLTDFLVSSAQAAAHATIQRHTLVELSARESTAFVAALLLPGEPNDLLRSAASRHTVMIDE
jgi:uncharacterized protein (DUF1778 family)